PRRATPRAHAHDAELVSLRERQISKEDGVDRAEDRGARADPDRQRENRRHGKPWIARELTRGEAEVLPNGLHPAEAPLVARTLLEARRVAELPERMRAGLACRHAVAAIGRDQPIEMCAHLLGHLGVERTAAPERPKLETNLTESI